MRIQKIFLSFIYKKTTLNTEVNMERSFECPICLDQYSSEVKPLLIPCGHTACIRCISSLKKQKILECPVCRTMHHNIEISVLSINYALISTEQKPVPKLSL